MENKHALVVVKEEPVDYVATLISKLADDDSGDDSGDEDNGDEEPEKANVYGEQNIRVESDEVRQGSSNYLDYIREESTKDVEENKLDRSIQKTQKTTLINKTTTQKLDNNVEPKNKNKDTKMSHVSHVTYSKEEVLKLYKVKTKQIQSAKPTTKTDMLSNHMKLADGDSGDKDNIVQEPEKANGYVKQNIRLEPGEVKNGYIYDLDYIKEESTIEDNIHDNFDKNKQENNAHKVQKSTLISNISPNPNSKVKTKQEETTLLKQTTKSLSHITHSKPDEKLLFKIQSLGKQIPSTKPAVSKTDILSNHVKSTFSHLGSPLGGNLARSQYFLSNPAVISVTSSQLSREGFKEDRNLPKGWRVRARPGVSPIYLSPEEVVVTTSFGVFEYIKCGEGLGGEGLRSLSNYLRNI